MPLMAPSLHGPDQGSVSLGMAVHGNKYRAWFLELGFYTAVSLVHRLFFHHTVSFYGFISGTVI